MQSLVKPGGFEVYMSGSFYKSPSHLKELQSCEYHHFFVESIKKSIIFCVNSLNSPIFWAKKLHFLCLKSPGEARLIAGGQAIHQTTLHRLTTQEDFARGDLAKWVKSDEFHGALMMFNGFPGGVQNSDSLFLCFFFYMGFNG